MAFQSRSRDPLFDSTTQAAIEKRSKELIGLLAIGLGLMLAAMIGTYTPDDSNWMVSSDAPVQNWLGQTGASLSFLLITFLGLGSWGLSLFAIGWGTRFLMHRGEERVVWATFMLLPWLILVALHFETLVPHAEWRNFHSFGLGGMIGNTALGGLLALMPGGLAFLVKFLSFLTALGTLALGAIVMGFSKEEIGRIWRFFLFGVVLAFGAFAGLLGRGASGGAAAARAMQARRAAQREDKQGTTETSDDDLIFSDPLVDEVDNAHVQSTPQFGLAPAPEASDGPAIAEKNSLLGRASSLIRRAEPTLHPEPELVEPQPAVGAEDLAEELPGDARIAQKIASAVRTRRAQNELDPNLPMTKGRGKRPEPLIVHQRQPETMQSPEMTLPTEPPLTAAHSAGTLAAVGPVAPAPDVSARLESAADMAPDHVPTEDLPTEYFADTAAYSADPHLAKHPVSQEPQLEQTPIEFFSETVPEDTDTGKMDVSKSAQAALQPAPAPMDIPVVRPRKAVVEKPQPKVLKPSTRAQAEAQPTFFQSDSDDFELPPLSLLANPDAIQRHHLSDEALEENARMLETVLDDYGVKGEIVSVRPGPVVTMYELEPAPGLKASRVIGLADDIARSMSALSARVSTVPGRSVIGIELPNDNREMVSFREILSSRDYGDGTHALPLALGKNIGGDAVVANLAKMPHLLIAGTTGSGKSVAINTMILSLLYKLTPEECRLIMIDPKMLELSVYDGIPHLLSPVVTDPKKAVVALKWVVGEMEDRYRKMSKMGVRNIAGFNARVEDALSKGEMFSRTVQTGFDEDTGEPIFETEEFEPKALPYIVVIVDEMADLMMVAGKEIEACIQRLAQMARASGIHLVMATQRPSVDVITGTIKANFPTRISFQVTSKVDSRTILGEMGAEQLLGMGDMLYMAGGSKIIRCHGPFVSDEEVEEVVNHLKQFGPADYVGGVVEGPPEEKADNIDAVLGLNTGGNTNGEDALYDQAVAVVIKDRKCSTSYIQRKLGIGYNKAARLVEQMEEESLVSAANHVGKREILVPEQ